MFKINTDKYFFSKYTKLLVGCGKCQDCQCLSALQKAVQIMCEVNTSELPCWFLTLTIDDDHLTDNYEIVPEDLTKYIKKLRINLKRQGIETSIRYVSRGEYGGKTSRPHYHLLLFNLDIPDLKPYSKSKHGHDLYSSEFLEKLWQKGSMKIMPLTIGNALYVTQHHYLDKITTIIPNHLLRVSHPVNFNIITKRQEEYSTYSSRPGIGNAYYHKYKDEIYPADYIVFNGQKYPVPDYFDTLYKRYNPEEYGQLIKERIAQIQITTIDQNLYKDLYNNAMNHTRRANAPY